MGHESGGSQSWLRKRADIFLTATGSKACIKAKDEVVTALNSRT